MQVESEDGFMYSSEEDKDNASIHGEQTSAPSFVSLYRNAGFSPYLASVGFVFTILVTIAMLGCCCIVAVTVQKKNRAKFNSSCNYLLALYSAFEFLHLCSYFVFACVVLSGINFIPYRSCVFVQIIPLYSLSMSKILMFFIGTDRLLGLLFPIWHIQLRIGRYLTFMVALSSLFAGYFLVSAILDALNPKNANLQIPCVIGDCYQGSVSVLYYRMRSAMILATMACYLFIWILVKRIYASRVNQQTRSVLKSMTAVNCALLFGLLVNTAQRTALEFMSPGFQQSSAAWLITRLGIGFSLLSLTMNAPILYMFSTDYRKALSHLLLLHFPGLPKRVSVALGKNVVVPVEKTKMFNVTAQLLQQSAVAAVGGDRRRMTEEAAGLQGPNGTT